MDVPWPVIGGIVALVGLLLTIVAVVTGWAVRVNSGERADESAKKAHARIDTLEREMSRVEVEAARELGNYKEKVARDYATQAQMNNIENLVIGEIHRLGDRIDRVLRHSPSDSD